MCYKIKYIFIIMKKYCDIFVESESMNRLSVLWFLLGNYMYGVVNFGLMIDINFFIYLFFR